MQFSHIISLASIATAVLATPHARHRDCKKPPTSAATAATLPSTGGSTDLPQPPEGATLKLILLGHGLQNYTCPNNTAAAVPAGALAVLYDVTNQAANPAFATLSSAILKDHAIPLTLRNPAAAGPVTATAPAPQDALAYQAAAGGPPFPRAPAPPLALPPADGLVATAPVAGVHYFDASGAPTFDLTAASASAAASAPAPGALFFAGTKAASTKAPADADKGLLASGAVDWLQLADNGRGASRGVRFVYRVATAGGAAQACSVSGPSPAGQVFSVPYAAQYWFYG